MFSDARACLVVVNVFNKIMIFRYWFAVQSVHFMFCLDGVYMRNYKENSGDIGEYTVFLDSSQLLKMYNYPSERHTIRTLDSYLLTVFRIPRAGPPILLVHGIADSSDSWLVLGPKYSLACQLADAGFDVWMFNSRGNKYNRNQSIGLTDQQYFNFSYEEMGYYDLPATIDYILAARTRVQLTYIGFSQGTTIFFVMCSMRPEYNRKIDHAILLAPVAWLGNIEYPLIDIFASNLDILNKFAKDQKIYELFPSNTLLNLYHLQVCNVNSPVRLLCDIEFYLNYGLRDITNLPSSRLPILASHIPAGSSSKTFFHFIQGYSTKRFQRYDYGPRVNQVMYSSIQPPMYNVSLTTVPLTLIVSESDWFSNIKDVDILRRSLKNIVRYVVLNKTLDFTHIEYVYGERVNKFINEPVISILRDLHFNR